MQAEPLIDLTPFDLSEDEHAIKVSQEQLTRLEQIRDEITKADGVTSAQARTLKTFIPSLESLFERYPVSSYTNLPTRTNLKVTQEGIGSAIWDAIVRAAKAIWRFLGNLWTGMINLVRRLFGFAPKAAAATKNAAEMQDAVNKATASSSFNAIDAQLREDYDAKVNALQLKTLGEMKKHMNSLFNDVVDFSLKKNSQYASSLAPMIVKTNEDISLLYKLGAAIAKTFNHGNIDQVVELNKSIVDEYDNLRIDNQWGLKPEVFKAPNYLSKCESVNAIINQLKSDGKEMDFNISSLDAKPDRLIDVVSGSSFNKINSLMIDVKSVDSSTRSAEWNYTGFLAKQKEAVPGFNNDGLTAFKNLAKAIGDRMLSIGSIYSEFAKFGLIYGGYWDARRQLLTALLAKAGLSDEFRDLNKAEWNRIVDFKTN